MLCYGYSFTLCVVGVEPVVLGCHPSQIAYEDRTRQASAYDQTPIERLTTHTMRLLDSAHAKKTNHFRFTLPVSDNRK